MLPVIRDDKQIGELKFYLWDYYKCKNGILRQWVVRKMKRALPALRGIRYSYEAGRYRPVGVLVG